MYPGLHTHRLPMLFGNRNPQTPVNQSSSSVESDKRTLLNLGAEPQKDTLYFSAKGEKGKKHSDTPPPSNKKKQKRREVSPARSYCTITKQYLAKLEEEQRQKQREREDWRYIRTQKGDQPYLPDPGASESDDQEIDPDNSASQVGSNLNYQQPHSRRSYHSGSDPLTGHNLRKLNSIREDKEDRQYRAHMYEEELRREKKEKEYQREKVRQAVLREEEAVKAEKRSKHEKTCKRIEEMRKEEADLKYQALQRAKEEKARQERLRREAEEEESEYWETSQGRGPIVIEDRGPSSHYGHRENHRPRNDRKHNSHYEIILPDQYEVVNVFDAPPRRHSPDPFNHPFFTDPFFKDSLFKDPFSDPFFKRRH